jgi:hypothetical protein
MKAVIQNYDTWKSAAKALTCTEIKQVYSASVQSIMAIIRHVNCIMKIQARLCHWRSDCENEEHHFKVKLAVLYCAP